MKSVVSLLLTAVMLVVGVSAGTTVAARAQESKLQSTITTTEPPVPVRAGDALQIIVHLTTTDGVAIDNQPVFVAAGTIIGGEPTQGRGTTDASGQATIKLRLPVGRMTFVAKYEGSATRGLAPSESAPDTLEVLALIAPTLTFDPVPIVPLGGHPKLVLHAEDDAGRPIAGVNVQITLDGQRLGTINTDELGQGSVALRPDLAAGTYTVGASYAGSSSRKIAAATASLGVDVGSASLQIHTVPPIPGIRFQLAELASSAQPGRVYPFTSDADGLASVAVDSPGAYALTTAADPNQAASGRRAAFARWSDDYFEPTRLLYIGSSLELSTGFDIDYRVNHAFRDLAQQPVDASRVTSVTLTNSLGEETTLTDDQPAWLRGSRIVRRANGLEDSRILYSVKSVIVDGSNVVNKDEQRFYPEQDFLLPISLSLFSMHISTRDALFGFSVGSAVRIQHPDGHTDRVPFGPNDDVSLSSLARGEYKLKIEGNGLSSSPPVALSRDQDVEVRVISYVDIAVAGTLGLVVVFGLLAVGRSRLLNRRRILPIPFELGSLEPGELR